MNDLISRADALALFYPDTQYWGDDIDNKLLSLPSADAVPQSEQYKKGFEDAKRAYEIELARSADAVQGEWIDRSNGGRIKYPWWESCECNQCGEYGSGAYNFCPNCGARMKGGAE